MMYGYGFGGDWFWHTLFGGFFMIIVWVAIILFVVWLVREVSEGRGKSDHKTPLDILKERYAKGELTKEQFESMKKDLH